MELVLRLSLLYLVLHPGFLGWERGPVLILAGLGLLSPSAMRRPALWAVLTGLVAFRVLSNWPGTDNHDYLLGYWCLAITCALTLPEPQAALARSARALLGLAFLFATLWKGWLSPDFVDGTFFRETLLLDSRFANFSLLVGDVTPAVQAANDLRLETFLSGGGPEAPLVEPARLRWIAYALTGWTLFIEAAIALCFLWPGRRGPARWRDASLLAFCWTTFAVATVQGFGTLLATLGLGQCGDATPRRLRALYVATFFLVLGYKVLPWSDWLVERFVHPAAVVDAAPREPGAVTVFRAGDGGYHTVRIPALVRTAEGSLLAFAEGRVESAADAGDIDLVMRSSSDRGASWGPLEVVSDVGADTAGNPSPVIDARSGRVVLLHNRGRHWDFEARVLTGTSGGTKTVWVTTSDDHGRTWEPPRDITGSVKPEDWRWYAVGPGHGVQLHHGAHAGRLVAGANHSRAGGIRAALTGALYGGHVLVSDDGGDTWSLGAVDSGSDALHPSETAVAELDDGRLVFNTRDQDGSDPATRAIAVSRDGGATFEAPFTPAPDLEAPVVQGSMLAVAGELVFASPGHRTERRDLALRTSRDGGATWRTERVVREGPAAYSDLVDLGDGRLGLLFETGALGPYERIDYLPLAWSTKIGDDQARSETGERQSSTSGVRESP